MFGTLPMQAVSSARAAIGAVAPPSSPAKAAVLTIHHPAIASLPDPIHARVVRPYYKRSS